MEPQEYAIANDSDESFIQDKTKMDVDKSTYVNKIDVSDNPFYNLIEQQAKIFEEFGKQMGLDWKNSYKDYVIQKKETTASIEMERIYKKFEEKLVSQSQLIDSLRYRIEELETDSIIKDQNYKKLQNEFNDFKKDLLIPAHIYNKKSGSSVSFVTDENENDWGVPNPNDMFNSTQEDVSFITVENDKDLDELFVLDSSQIQDPTLKKLHSEVRQVIIANRFVNLKLRFFGFLKRSYTINVLIQYTKIPEFYSLDKKSRRYINYHIKSMMTEEFKKQNVILSQNLNEYIERDILPLGCDNYIMNEDSDWFESLSEVYKSRVRKLIKNE